jgi:hypothetical protein
MTLLTPFLAWLLALSGLSALPACPTGAYDDGLPEMVTCGSPGEDPDDDEIEQVVWFSFVPVTEISNGF